MADLASVHNRNRIGHVLRTIVFHPNAIAEKHPVKRNVAKHFYAARLHNARRWIGGMCTPPHGSGF